MVPLVSNTDLRSALAQNRHVTAWLHALFFAALLPLVATPVAQAQDKNLILAVETVSSVVGAQEEVKVFLDSSASDAFSGWSVAVCHDPSLLTLEGVELGSSVLALDPDFDQTNTLASGWTCAVVVDFIGQVSLPPGPAHELNVATYTLDVTGFAELRLCDDELGTPPVSISFGSTSILPTLVDGGIEVGTVPNYILRMGSAVAAQGEEVEVPLELDHLLAIDGFSVGIGHDFNVATLIDIVPGDALLGFNEGAGPDYFFMDADLAESNGGACGVLFSTTAPFERLEPADAQELLRFVYEVNSSAPDEAATPLAFSDELGNPQITTLLVRAGEARIPALEEGSLTVSGDPTPTGTEFVRGDVDANGTIDVSDGVNLLTYLFAGGTAPTCEDAADVDDDGTVGIADGIALLSFSFAGGTAPAPPTDTCGTDPTDDAITCTEFAGCP